MLNLLHNKDQKKIYQEYRLRRLVVFLALIILVSLFVIGFLLPSLIISISKKQIALGNLSVQQYKNSASIKLLDGEVSNTKAKLAVLRPWAAPSVFQTFAVIIAQAPEGVLLSGFEYTLGQKDTKTSTAQITISGIAASRDSLEIFSKILEANPKFSQVTLPISNFTKDTNINFSLKLVVDETL